eukprot:TRINITY_DN3250_c0_g1_i1.p2 TRINITY_DN3250_c0_g1~~TRINITY_DN3250_c0_g1_i1.p2  ORF type:complete len:158 (+),score=56.96 TRINITY_DN3250_c0_g1_i1:1318-1791(+)
MGGPCKCDGKTYHCMDNFAKIPFKLDGLTWISCEQYFQAKKFVDEAHIAKIRNETEGTKQWELGQKRSAKRVPNWEEVKIDVMYEANKAKFEQDDGAREELLSTTGRIEAGGFPFWKKWNELILERLREELRPEPDTEKIEKYKKAFERYRVEQKGK